MRINHSHGPLMRNVPSEFVCMLMAKDRIRIYDETIYGLNRSSRTGVVEWCGNAECIIGNN